MIREIVTNYGNFNKFSEIENLMRIEKIQSIDILKIILWNGSVVNSLTGTFSYSDIKKIVD